MNLILDAGNSYVKIAVFQSDRLVQVDSVKYDAFYENFLKIFLEYPEVEFMTTEQLGVLIRESKKNENSNT